MASGLVMRRIWWMRWVSTASWASLGMKSGLQPCWGCGVQEGWLAEGEPAGLLGWGVEEGWLAEGEPSGLLGCGRPLETMGAASGSQRMILVSGRFSARTRE